MRDMADDQVSYSHVLEGYNDTASLRRIRTDGDTDVSFSFEDTSRRQGDYYFVRVEQANDAVAWSSPIWVGGSKKY